LRRISFAGRSSFTSRENFAGLAMLPSSQDREPPAIPGRFTAERPQYPCRHALCGVHLRRELTFLAEEYRLRRAAALERSRLTMKVAVARARAADHPPLDAVTRARHWRRYRALLAAGEAAEPPPRRAGPTKGKLKRTAAGRPLGSAIWTRH
jgi:hypothetical protein